MPTHLMIPLSYVQPVLDELERMGHTREQLFRDADISAGPDTCDVERASLPAMEFTRLYRHVFHLLEAETSQRADGSRLGKDVVDMMCYCSITCADLAEVIERVSTFTRIIGPLGAAIELQHHGATVRLVMDLYRGTRDTASLLVCLAAMNVLHQLFSWLIGERIQLRDVSVRYPAPADYVPMADLLGVPLHYGSETDQLSFSAHYLDLPVVRSYAQLQQIIDYLPFDIWYSGHAGGALSERVRMLVLSALQHQRPLPGSDAVAQLFHMSPATLRRRLREEQSPYAKIRADCQREYAQHLLTFTDQSVQDIALRLGFGDDRAFRRAFRHWNGLSPSEFRELK